MSLINPISSLQGNNFNTMLNNSNSQNNLLNNNNNQNLLQNNLFNGINNLISLNSNQGNHLTNIINKNNNPLPTLNLNVDLLKSNEGSNKNLDLNQKMNNLVNNQQSIKNELNLSKTQENEILNYSKNINQDEKKNNSLKLIPNQENPQIKEKSPNATDSIFKEDSYNLNQINMLKEGLSFPSMSKNIGNDLEIKSEEISKNPTIGEISGLQNIQYLTDIMKILTGNTMMDNNSHDSNYNQIESFLINEIKLEDKNKEKLIKNEINHENLTPNALNTSNDMKDIKSNNELLKIIYNENIDNKKSNELQEKDKKKDNEICLENTNFLTSGNNKHLNETFSKEIKNELFSKMSTLAEKEKIKKNSNENSEKSEKSENTNSNNLNNKTSNNSIPNFLIKNDFIKSEDNLNIDSKNNINTILSLNSDLLNSLGNYSLYNNSNHNINNNNNILNNLEFNQNSNLLNNLSTIFMNKPKNNLTNNQLLGINKNKNIINNGNNSIQSNDCNTDIYNLLNLINTNFSNQKNTPKEEDLSKHNSNIGLSYLNSIANTNNVSENNDQNENIQTLNFLFDFLKNRNCNNNNLLINSSNNQTNINSFNLNNSNNLNNQAFLFNNNQNNLSNSKSIGINNINNFNNDKDKI